MMMILDPRSSPSSFLLLRGDHDHQVVLLHPTPSTCCYSRTQSSNQPATAIQQRREETANQQVISRQEERI